MEKPLRLLILDDDPEVLKHLTASLTMQGGAVASQSVTEAREGSLRLIGNQPQSVKA